MPGGCFFWSRERYEKVNKVLFCLPYAGGSAGVFHDWSTALKGVAVVCPLEYAGRGRRFRENFRSTIEETAEDICDQIRSKQENEYILFGYSMGCLVALESVFELKRRSMPLPKALIVAATCPPHLMDRDRHLSGLSPNELMKEISSFGQMDEVPEGSELYEIVSRILYADVQMFSNYHRDHSEKLSLPILALAGKDDTQAPPEDMKEWCHYTTGPFTFRAAGGGHFFAFQNDPEVYRMISDYLNSL